MNTKNINFLNLINRRTILEALEMKNIDIINYILDINGVDNNIIDLGILYKIIDLDDFILFKKIIEIKGYNNLSSLRNEYVFKCPDHLLSFLSIIILLFIILFILFILLLIIFLLLLFLLWNIFFHLFFKLLNQIKNLIPTYL
jgi:hypothetical protein